MTAGKVIHSFQSCAFLLQFLISISFKSISSTMFTFALLSISILFVTFLLHPFLSFPFFLPSLSISFSLSLALRSLEDQSLQKTFVHSFLSYEFPFISDLQSRHSTMSPLSFLYSFLHLDFLSFFPSFFTSLSLWHCGPWRTKACGATSAHSCVSCPFLLQIIKLVTHAILILNGKNTDLVTTNYKPLENRER